MKVLILAGGVGSRLSEETVNKPKPLVEIGNKPILWHIMKIYASHGFTDFILLLGYKGDMIKEYFIKNPEDNWDIEFVDTGLEASKAQRILRVRHLINDDYFFLAYGDDVSDINPNDVFDFHKRQGKVVTLAAIPLESNFGIVEIDEDNLIKRFREKPKIDGYWINGGFFCFSKEIFDYLNDEDELEDQTFKKLAVEKKISAFKYDGFWKCMNTNKDKLELNKIIDENKAPWINW